MRYVPLVLSLLLFGGCDLFSLPTGETSFELSGDVEATTYTGDAFVVTAENGDGVTRSRVVLEGDDGEFTYTVYIEAPGQAFEEGTQSISRTSPYSVRVPVLLTDSPRGVSGTVTITSVRGGDVTGSFDVGVTPYGDTASRFIRGTFRAPER